MDGLPVSNAIVPFFGLLGALGADQASKSWAMSGRAVDAVPRWLRPVHCHHRRLGRPAAVATLATLAALLPVVALWLPSPHATAAAAALGLAVGGAAGNLLDQRRFGGVRDFIDLGLGAFNAADVAIVGGVFAAAVILLSGSTA